MESDLAAVDRLPEDSANPLDIVQSLNASRKINVLGLHGDHSAIFRSGGGSPLQADDLSQLVDKENVRGSVVFNLGSHGGLNLEGDAGDLVETFTSKGVGAYIGSSAYAGSSRSSIGFTEDLASRFMQSSWREKKSQPSVKRCGTRNAVT